MGSPRVFPIKAITHSLNLVSPRKGIRRRRRSGFVRHTTHSLLYFPSLSHSLVHYLMGEKAEENTAIEYNDLSGETLCPETDWSQFSINHTVHSQRLTFSLLKRFRKILLPSFTFNFNFDLSFNFNFNLNLNCNLDIELVTI